MKTGLIILCRFSSSRLPGKILMKVQGKTILEHIIHRLQFVSNAPEIIVATSTDSSDDIIERSAYDLGVKIFRGELEDLGGRFLKAAEHFELDHAVRINGDNLFIEHNIIEAMINISIENDLDFVTNATGRTFPFGMSVEVIKTEFYKKCYSEFNSPGHFEHVTKWMYENISIGKRFDFMNTEVPQAAKLPLAIDTKEDLDLANQMMLKLGNFNENVGLKEIYHAYQKCNNVVYS
jgi:spore coat polysaccharide biosynthesis protein SpsF